MEKKKYLNTVGGNVNWCTQYGKHDEGSSKIRLPHDPAIPLLGIYWEKAVNERKIHYYLKCLRCGSNINVHCQVDKEDVVHIYNGTQLSHKTNEGNSKIKLPYDPAVPLLDIYWEKAVN